MSEQPAKAPLDMPRLVKTPAKKSPWKRPNASRLKALANRTFDADVPNQEDGEEAGPLAPEGFDPNEDLLQMVIPPPPEIAKTVDESGARLIITHIELENFKSFYGHHVIGPLHKVER